MIVYVKQSFQKFLSLLLSSSLPLSGQLYENSLCKPCSQLGWPCCQDEVQYAIESYSEQLSINIAKTMSQLFCEKRKLQNRHDK